MVGDEGKLYKVGHTINFIILLVLCAAMLYPFIYFFAISLNDGYDAMKGGIYFWPRKFTLDNYITAFENENISNAFFLSVMRTVIGTVTGVFFRATVGYALSRKQLCGKNPLTFYFYLTTLISGGMVPTYILFRQLHLLNNFLVYIIPTLYSFFDIVMFRTYFSGIPDELEEAACVDGSGSLRTFFTIYLPVAKPILATLALFSAVGHWNDWFTGAFYVTDVDLQPAATLLQKLIEETDFTKSSGSREYIDKMVSSQTTTPESLRITFVMILTIPIVCVYPFLQKYFVKGVMIGAIKS